MTEHLTTGATIGILGGGQLGRMLSVAAARLGFKTCVFEPGADCPASHVAHEHIQAGYDDEDALRRFAGAVDVVTYEFENIPTSALDLLDGLGKPVRPGRTALRISQDRLTEKAFLSDLGLKTAPFAAVDDEEDLAEAMAEIGLPAILKTRRFGYDGKGQARILSEADAAQGAGRHGRAVRDTGRVRGVQPRGFGHRRAQHRGRRGLFRPRRKRA